VEIDPLYGQVFEVCPTPIVIATEDGLIVRANRATNALFRIASPLAGRRLSELIPDWPEFPEGKLQIAVGRNLDLSDGRSIPVDLNISVMRIGGVRYFAFTIHDQSENKKLLVEIHNLKGD
jgi:PAS domain S-box-containing protein